MVAQKKFETTLQERINEYQTSSTAENTSPATVDIADTADTADDLINALDTLLLEKALEEHRVALARVNKLKLALGKGQASGAD